MSKISKQAYETLRDEIWDDLVAAGVSSDEDENFTSFDEVLGSHLPVDWSWDELPEDKEVENFLDIKK